jgi:hypothetical protein
MLGGATWGRQVGKSCAEKLKTIPPHKNELVREH